ncbi:hypothetical protein SAMN03159448_04390 [Sinorhizobium sp. NFACC03]|nr:hypothetical protein SAMN03159448_04390 [Sinorhizobium sp. NFACC03]
MVLGRLSAFGTRPKIKMHGVSRESIMSVLGRGLGVTITCEGAAGAQYPDVVLRVPFANNQNSSLGRGHANHAPNTSASRPSSW